MMQLRFRVRENSSIGKNSGFLHLARTAFPFSILLPIISIPSWTSKQAKSENIVCRQTKTRERDENSREVLISAEGKTEKKKQKKKTRMSPREESSSISKGQILFVRSALFIRESLRVHNT